MHFVLHWMRFTSSGKLADLLTVRSRQRAGSVSILLECQPYILPISQKIASCAPPSKSPNDSARKAPAVQILLEPLRFY